MAQNISVTLVLDDRQYTAKLKAAESATKNFSQVSETSALAATRAFDRLNAGTDALVRRFGGLRTAIAGLGFAALGQSALASADDLMDLSNASGIAVGRLLELKKALTTSGGQADQMGTALNNLLRTIDEAAEGSIKAQNSFMGLNISMNDLRTLSEQDLFTKILEGIADIESPTRRAALMMEYFGKSFKTVDPRELLDKLRATRGEGDRYAETIKRAAELNDALATAQGNLKLAFLEAFSPIIGKINEFNAATEAGSSKMKELITIIKIVGATLVTALATSILLPFVATIGTLLRGISAIGVALGGAALPAYWIASSGAAARFLPILRAIAVLFAGGLGIYTATKLFDNLGDVASNALARIVEGVGEVAASFLNLPTDLIGKLLGIDNPVGLGTPLQKLVENARRAREAYEKEFAKKPAVLPEPTGALPGAGGREVDESARQNAIQNIRDITSEFEKQQKIRLGALNLETDLVGKSQEERQLAEAQREIYLEYSNTFANLEKRRLSLGKDEQYLNGEIIKQQEKLYQIYLEQDALLVEAIKKQQAAKEQLADSLRYLKLSEELKKQATAYDQIRQAQSRIGESLRFDLQFQIRKLKMSEDEIEIAEALNRETERYLQLRDDLGNKLTENFNAIAAEQKRQHLLTGEELKNSQDRITLLERENDEIRKTIDTSYEGHMRNGRVIEENLGLLQRLRFEEKQRQANLEYNTKLLEAQFKTQQSLADILRNINDKKVELRFEQSLDKLSPLQRRIAEIQENARKAAVEAGRAFAGSFEEDDGLSPERAEELAEGLRAIAQGFKDIADQQIEAITRFKTFQELLEENFKAYAEDALDSNKQIKDSFENTVKGLEDAFVRFALTGKLSFQDMANSILADLARIAVRRAIVFAGSALFGLPIPGRAEGGPVDARSPYIVGERGPELFIPNTAGKIVPNAQLGGQGMAQGGATAVTYNINAVDAASFRALVARDPSFIYSVTEQGRRNTPSRSR